MEIGLNEVCDSWSWPNNPNYTTRGNTEAFTSQTPLVEGWPMTSKHLSSSAKSTLGPVRINLLRTQKKYTLQFPTSEA